MKWHQCGITTPPEKKIVLVWFPPHDADLRSDDLPDMFPAIADLCRHQWQHPEGGVVDDMHTTDRWLDYEDLATLPVEGE